jgi:SET domain-containing protein
MKEEVLEEIAQDFDIEFIRRNVVDTIRDTVIKKSMIHGFGLFSTKTLFKGEILQIFDGQILTEKQYKTLISNISKDIGKYKNYFFMECNKLDYDTFLVRPFRTKYSYINHSLEPNVCISHHPLRLIVKVDINIGEEITIDYTKEQLKKEYLDSNENRFLFLAAD